MTPLPEALLKPRAFGCRSDVCMPLNGPDRIERMLDAIDAVHEVFPNPASRADRVGTHGFLTTMHGRERTICLRHEADGDIVAGLRTDRTASSPFMEIRILRALDAPGAEEMGVLPVSRDNVDVVDNLRRFGSFVRAHLPQALRALHRSRMSQAEVDDIRHVRERCGMIATLLSYETGSPVTCDMDSPLSPLRIRPCTFSGARFSFHDDLITPERLSAWRTPRFLQAGLFEPWEGCLRLDISPVCETRNAERIDPLELMRGLEGLPTP